MEDSSTKRGDLIGYARVSTWDQNPDLQVDALRGVGCTRVFADHASGTRTDRPQLAACMDYARSGDTIVVWRLDRLGRSLRHLVETVSAFEERGIGFRSLHESIDTTTSTGRLVFHIFAALAEFERDPIVDRTQAGLAAAKARGKTPGRKPKLSRDQVAVVQRLYADGERNVSEIAKVLGVSRATVYRNIASPPKR